MDGPDSPPDSRFADSRFATVTPTHPPTTTATRGPRARADPAARGLIGAPRVHVAAGGRAASRSFTPCVAWGGRG